MRPGPFPLSSSTGRRLPRLLALFAMVVGADGAQAQTGADLTVSLVSNSADAVAPGMTLTVTDAVGNGGTADAGPSITRFYLSIDAIKSSADKRLSGSRAVGPLPVGLSSSGSSVLTVPATMPAGAYRLLACADDTRTVAESLETNNCSAGGTRVEVQLPDLVVQAVSATPQAVAPGAAFKVTDTTRNLSALAAPASTTRYYLSVDRIRDLTDVALSGSRAVATLSARGSSTGTMTVSAAAATPLGTYFVLACADDQRKVSETDDTNNCGASTAAVTLARPDLITTSLSDPPPSTIPGATFAVTDHVANVGEVAAVKSKTQYYLSVDGTYDADDLPLVGTRSVPALAAGGASSGGQTVTVPTTAAHGTYVLLACADGSLQVGETNEANNCRASTAQVAVRAPNAAPTADGGDDRDVSVGAMVELDGSASSDADGDPLTYAWTMVSRPPASTAQLTGAATARPGLLVDVDGQYVIQLVVDDGKDSSRPGVVVVASGALRFAALGDTGLGDAGQYAGAAALDYKCRRSGCAFAVLLGDNIYQSGVTSVADPQFDTKFEMPYANNPLPFYAVLGNHDYGGGGRGDEFEKGQFQVDYSAVSAKWRMPAASYRFSSGPVDFVGLDTNMQMYGIDAQQRVDVQSWLSLSTAPWKIALGHHPYRSNGQHGNAGAYNGVAGVPVDSGDGVKSFMEDIVCGRADILLSGHDHNLQWLEPDGTCVGTELIVSGAGARPKSLRGSANAGYNRTYFQAAQLGLAYLVVTPQQLTVEFVGENGAVLFVKTITKVP